MEASSASFLLVFYVRGVLAMLGAHEFFFLLSEVLVASLGKGRGGELLNQVPRPVITYRSTEVKLCLHTQLRKPYP